VVKTHYGDFVVPRVKFVRTSEDRYAYVSYRRHDQVLWTQQKLRIPKGELLLTDGTNLARARCGNRLSEEAPVAAKTQGGEPNEFVFNTPVSFDPLPLEAEEGEVPAALTLPLAADRLAGLSGATPDVGSLPSTSSPELLTFNEGGDTLVGSPGGGPGAFGGGVSPGSGSGGKGGGISGGTGSGGGGTNSGSGGIGNGAAPQNGPSSQGPSSVPEPAGAILEGLGILTALTLDAKARKKRARAERS
jgi:hypothetical protein